MYQKVLLAVDGSENAKRAAEEALKIISTETIVKVIYVADFNKVKTDILHTQSESSLLLQRKQKVAPIEQLLSLAHVTYQTEILHGSPSEEIVRFANQHAIDIIILGSRGLNTLQEFVIGSVSHKVLKTAKCPVLIVK